MHDAATTPVSERPRTGGLDLVRRFLLWTFVCWVSAGPSVFIAAHEWNPWGIVAGVFAYVVLYTYIGGTEFVRRLRDDPAIDTTLWIGYGTRMVVSVIFPVSMVIDIGTGFLSVGLSECLWGKSRDFAATFGTTLVDGACMNALLGLYMLVVFGFARLAMPKRVPEGLCRQCRYDLRGSRMSARCPECGTPTPWAGQVSDQRVNAGKQDEEGSHEEAQKAQEVC